MFETLFPELGKGVFLIPSVHPRNLYLLSINPILYLTRNLLFFKYFHLFNLDYFGFRFHIVNRKRQTGLPYHSFKLIFLTRRSAAPKKTPKTPTPEFRVQLPNSENPNRNSGQKPNRPPPTQPAPQDPPTLISRRPGRPRW